MSLFMRVNTSTIPPFMGTVPPLRFVPAPRGVTGIPSSFATFMMAETCSVPCGSSTTSGIASSTEESYE